MIFFSFLPLILILNFGCTSSSPQNEKQELFNKISYGFIQKMKDEEGMFTLGKGGSLTGGENGDKVREFGMYFQSKKLVNVTQARNIVLRSAKNLLDTINNNAQIRPHLVRYPYEESGVSFIFKFLPYEADQPSTSANYVSTVFFGESEITYFYYDPQKDKDFITLEETYKEALERNANIQESM